MRRAAAVAIAGIGLFVVTASTGVPRGVGWAADPAAAQTGDPEVGRAIATAAGCVNCHGPLGVSSDPLIPNLAGQNQEYLIHQLQLFRKPPGARPMPKRRARCSDHTMDSQAAPLTDPDIAHVVAFFSALWCGSSGAEADVAPPPRAARCMSCHGPDGMSENEVVPRLAGQKTAYLGRQLRLFRDAARDAPRSDEVSGRFHPIMGSEAVLLTDAEIDDMSTFFSGQSCW